MELEVTRANIDDPEEWQNSMPSSCETRLFNNADVPFMTTIETSKSICLKLSFTIIFFPLCQAGLHGESAYVIRPTWRQRTR